MIQKEVILPKLYDCNGEITEQWFVYFSVFNPGTGRMKVFRKYKGFAELKTAEERRKFAKKTIAYWKRKLLNGWNPFFENDKVKYANLLKYNYDTARTGNAVETSRNFEYYSSLYLDYVLNDLSRSKATYTCYKSKLRIFGQYLKEKRIDKVSVRFYNKETILDFNRWLRDKRKLSGGALNDYNDQLKRFFSWLIEQRSAITENPLEGMHREKRKPVHHKAYNETYTEMLQKAIEPKDPWLWLMVRMIFNCFTRPKELRFLQMKHINWIDGTILVPADIAKNNRDGIVTIPEYLLQILHDFGYHTYPAEYYFMSVARKPGPAPVSKNFLYNQLKPYLVRLNLPKGFTLYSWKHTGVQRLARAKVDLMYIKNQLRHASYDQMLPYIEELLAQANEEIKSRAPRI